MRALNGLQILLEPEVGQKVHLADFCPKRLHTYIYTLMVVAAMQGANQHIRSSLGNNSNTLKIASVPIFALTPIDAQNICFASSGNAARTASESH